MTNKQIKSLALIKLKGSWGNGIAITLSFFAVLMLSFLGDCMLYMLYDKESTSFLPVIPSEGLQTAISVGINIFFYLILIMISYTFLREFIDIRHGRDYNISRNRIMSYKKLFFKVSFVPQVAKMGIILLCSLPGFLAYDSIKTLTEQPYDKTLSVFVLMFFMMSVLVILLSAVLVINALLCLHLLPTVIMLNPLLPLSHAISMCFRKAEGNKLRIALFHLSFLKYLPVCLLLYPICVVFPYYMMSNLLLCEDILGKDLAKDTFLDVFTEKDTSPVKGI